MENQILDNMERVVDWNLMVVMTSDTLNRYGLCRDGECCCKYK